MTKIYNDNGEAITIFHKVSDGLNITIDSNGRVSYSFGNSRRETAAHKLRMKQAASALQRIQETYEGLANGTISPLDKERHAAAIRSQNDYYQDIRMKFTGIFESSWRTYLRQDAPKSEVTFLTRQDAMATAYHFAERLADYGKMVAKDAATIQANRDTLLDSSGQLYGLTKNGQVSENPDEFRKSYSMGTSSMIHSMKTMEGAAASLAQYFGFDSRSVTLPAYDGDFQGFSVATAQYGKILDVAADGTMTFYDANGTAYSAKEYNDQNIDDGIPALHNALIRQADKESALAEYNKAREERRLSRLN
ncbi:MAG: hypothetical protein Q4G24_06105 [Paracoccus sp. (in: a-proteobacteria)]|uniref:hypothetical protein n=1 Tax=Paracoccus sp. TaxID=267 RepID=UPI0026E009B2|nr:hypothetical protein [Paracoccus sp. (in: a-proteobacteria)]MDO5621027.1 hypothetical protein [Paracoccus sp. (in: a-proteobacteria)]